MILSGVPALVDFAAMRDTVKRLGGNPSKINPVAPADLVIDHSVQVDVFRRQDSIVKLCTNRVTYTTLTQMVHYSFMHAYECSMYYTI